MIEDVIDLYRYTPPDAWGVLCIDVWENNGVSDDFYHRAIVELKNYNIQSVVNCTTFIKVDYDDPSIFNTFEKYQWNPEISAVDTNQQVMLNLIKASGKIGSSNVLKQHLFDKQSIHLSDPTTFTQHINHFCPDIQHWIVLGGTWGICTHHGPLGFNKLLEIPSASFHIFPSWSIYTQNGNQLSTDDVINDGFIWATIPNDGYRLINKVHNKKWTT